MRSRCFGSVQANAICSQCRIPWFVRSALRKGLGPGVFEVVSDFKTDTFRAGYVVRFEQAIYVLHCFQKKSPSGTRTAKTDIEMIEHRLKMAKADYEVRYGQASQKRE